MDSNKYGTADIIGVILKALLIMIAGLGAIYFISILVMPVIDQLSDVFSMISGSFGHGRRAKSYHDIAVIALILIFLIGIAKTLTRKK